MPAILGWTVGETPSEQFSSLSKRYPRPSNAQALAVLDAVFEFVDADSGERAGLPTPVARAFLHPLGIIPRMRLLACGWTKPGDKFRKASDRAWWTKRYQHPLWEPLGTWIDSLAHSDVGQRAMVFEEAIANAEPAALSRELATAVEDLRIIRAANADICAPFLIPRRRGVMPEANIVCITRIEAGDKLEKHKEPIEAIFRPALPWWVVVGLVFVASKVIDRR